MNATLIDRLFAFFMLFNYYENNGYQNLESILNESMEEIFKNFVRVVARSCQTINSFNLDQIEYNG